MGYERNDRRYGSSDYRSYGGTGADRGRYGDQNSGRDQYGQRDYGNYGGGGQRDYRGDRFNDRSDRSDYGRTPQGYDYQDRGFFDRAGDEVRSWFGDEDAERRRRMDERNDERYRDDTSGYDAYGSSNRGYGDTGYGANRGGYSRSDYGQSANRGYGQSSNRNAGHDPSYSSWRDRQMASFDRDYDEYRREHQSKFDNEFATWRQGRQGQRDLLNKVEEHHEVVGSDGQHVGTVDHVRGDRIELTKSDQAAGGKHHIIPSAWVASVEDNKVTLNRTADQAKQQWRDEQRNDGGLFGNDRDQNDRNLNRSFSGTY